MFDFLFICSCTYTFLTHKNIISLVSLLAVIFIKYLDLSLVCNATVECNEIIQQVESAQNNQRKIYNEKLVKE